MNGFAHKDCAIFKVYLCLLSYCLVMTKPLKINKSENMISIPKKVQKSLKKKEENSVLLAKNKIKRKQR